MFITVTGPEWDPRIRAGYDDASQLVDLGDGLAIHTDTRVRVDQWGPHGVEIGVCVVQGRLAAESVRVTRRDDAPVTSESLRKVPVAELVRHAGHAVRYVDERDGRDDRNPFGSAWPTEQEGAYVARHGFDEESLRIAARVYRVAYLVGDPPTAKVEKLLGLPRSTAGRWVAEARQRGHLSAARGPGKAGG